MIHASFFSLIQNLVEEARIEKPAEYAASFNSRVFFFVQKEWSLMPFQYRAGIYIFIKFFFYYVFVCSKFHRFHSLNTMQQNKMIQSWIRFFPPGKVLFRLLRSLILLYVLESKKMDGASK